MHYRYERVCIETDCDEETTEEIRKYLDREASRLYRQRKARGEEGIVFNRFSSFVSEDGDHIGFEDAVGDFEEEYFHEYELQEIRDLLEMMSPEDRDFLLAVFDKPGSERKVADAMKVSRKAVRYRKRKLLKKMRRVLIDGEDAKKVL